MEQISEENIARLEAQIRTGPGIVPFVGAGISVPVGYPGWTAFLLQQAERFERRAEIAALIAAGRYEDAAETLSSAQGPRDFEDAIDSAFGTRRLPRRKLNGAATWLPRIAAGPVITTNFDRVLETCFEQAQRPFEERVCGARYELAAKALMSDRRFLLKIHGDVEYRQDRVLTRAEYDLCYGPESDESVDYPLKRLLHQIWQARSVLFVGCSLSADRTMQVLRELAVARPELILYAILEAPANSNALPDRVKFLSERGIRPIWYPAGQHENVERILGRLADRRGRAAKARPRRPGKRKARVSAKPTAQTSPDSDLNQSPSQGPVRVVPSAAHKFKIYISCGWHLQGLCEQVRAAVLAAGHQPLFDENWDPDATAMSKSAVATLREAHGLLTLLTAESLAHAHVCAELQRADSLMINICALAERSPRTKLPWFVRAAEMIDVPDRDGILAVIPVLIASLRPERLAEHETVAVARSQIVSIFRVWKREALGSSNRQWQLGLARQIVDNAAQELESLNKNRFESFIGRGHNFLLRALPVFECAERVFAVSVDTVSKFGVSDERADQQIAKKYWRAQPQGTHRMFVFTSPESAHNYATILNIHARKYGESGRVYLCSLASYTRFAAAAGLLGASCDHATCDYAALDYDSGTGTVTYVATLDSEKFHVFKEPDRVLARHMDDFKQGLLKLDGLELGQIDADSNIMRWHVDMQNDPRTWAERLKVLFGSRRPDVCHLVFVKREALEAMGVRAGLQAVIGEVRNTLAELQELQPHKVRLKDFWVGDAHEASARDGQFDGRINNGGAMDYPLVLMLRFEDEDALLTWYGDKSHSALRRRFYEVLDKRVSQLYERAESSTAKHAAVIYEDIEHKLSTCLVRRDYVEADTIDC